LVDLLVIIVYLDHIGELIRVPVCGSGGF